jgi:HAD superfamily hydrolase (TIGR01662 family)
MKQPIRAVFFDLGNTLMYDKNPWGELFRRAEVELWRSLHRVGVTSSGRELYGEHHTFFDYYYKLRAQNLDEPGILPVFRQLLDDKQIQVSEPDLLTAFHSMYTVTQDNWFVEPDAVPTLLTLKEYGYHLGIISNSADDENTYTLIDKGHLRSYFEFIISSAAFGKRKPHPAIFHAALDHFNIPAEQAVMVGDLLEADILGARAVGMNTIWITRHIGKMSNPGGVEPDATVSTLSEIPALILA